MELQTASRYVTQIYFRFESFFQFNFYLQFIGSTYLVYWCISSFQIAQILKEVRNGD